MSNHTVSTDFTSLLEALRAAITEAPSHRQMSRLRERMYNIELELRAHAIALNKLSQLVHAKAPATPPDLDAVKRSIEIIFKTAEELRSRVYLLETSKIALASKAVNLGRRKKAAVKKPQDAFTIALRMANKRTPKSRSKKKLVSKGR